MKTNFKANRNQKGKLNLKKNVLLHFSGFLRRTLSIRISMLQQVNYSVPVYIINFQITRYKVVKVP